MPKKPSKKKSVSDARDHPPLLATKLYIPPLRPSLVPRPRLVERLADGMARKLTLISAPAGFGKTTLLSEWINQSEFPVAWFSIDKNDNDPVYFLNYVIVALQTIEENIGSTALNLLQFPQPPPGESILVTLINSITPFPKDFVLVLDDYHLVENTRIHGMMAFLLDNLPQKMHFVIATRSDPPLPLARLRSQNQLTELRAVDLCFTTDETFKFLNETLKLKLSNEDIALIESRTEGWITGLQLAALSLQDRKDAPSLIKAFKGDNRYVADYLMEEVLNSQPEHIQNFLLQTSILDPLSGPLCDAVTDQNDSQLMLNTLERANLFIFPLDNERNWFRYHQLFADLLQQRLLQTQSDLIPELHRRASAWFAKNEMKDEAVNHALAAQDFERAMPMIEEIAEIDWDRGRESKLLRWFKIIPDEQIASSPQLSIFHARELFEDGSWQAAEKRLQEAEQMVEITEKKVGKTSPETFKQFKGSKVELQGRIAVIRAMMASYRGNMASIIKHSRQALKSLREEDLMWRSVAATMLGFAHGWSGDGDMIKAWQAFSEAKAISEAAGNIYMNLFASHCLYAVEMLQGRYKEAKDKLQKLIQYAEENGLSQIGIAGNNYATLGIIFCEMNDLEEGIGYIEKSIQIAKQGHDPIALVGCYFNLLRALYYKRDITGAEEIIKKIEKVREDFALPPWMIHTLEASKALIWLASGDLGSTSHWAEDRGLTIDDELSQRREIEHFALARILIAQDRLDEADHLLRRLIKNVEKGNRILMMIQMRLLRVLVFYKRGDVDSALDELKLALSLAESGGFIRLFVNEGPPLAELLEKILDEKKKVPDREKISFSRAYVKRLLTAFKTVTPPKKDYGLVEPLSERELEVLYLIAAGLTNQEIAKKLFISLNTVRTHTKNINSKLNVHNRTQAAARAKELGIL